MPKKFLNIKQENNHLVIKILGIKLKFKNKKSTFNKIFINNEINNKDLKILIAYHKKATLLKNDFVEPIHVGRALSTEISKDGKLSNEDNRWMQENMIGDDTGDNISHLNRYFNEMTAIYWAWKNYDKLGNPKYFGFMHYRSIFLFSRYPYYEDNYLDCCGYQEVKKILNNCPNSIITGDWWNPDETLYEHFENFYKANVAGYNIMFFDTLLDILKETDLQLYSAFTNWINGKIGGPFKNMFVLPKDLFFKYCNFIFPILFKLKDQLFDYQYANIVEMRNIAYLSEYLTAFYMNKIKTAEKDISVINVPIIRPF